MWIVYAPSPPMTHRIRDTDLSVFDIIFEVLTFGSWAGTHFGNGHIVTFLDIEFGDRREHK